jgi:hypothetical protein
VIGDGGGVDAGPMGARNVWRGVLRGKGDDAREPRLAFLESEANFGVVTGGRTFSKRNKGSTPGLYPLRGISFWKPLKRFISVCAEPPR